MTGIFNPFFDPFGIKDRQIKNDEDRVLGGGVTQYLREQNSPAAKAKGVAAVQTQAERNARNETASVCRNLARAHTQAERDHAYAAYVDLVQRDIKGLAKLAAKYKLDVVQTGPAPSLPQVQATCSLRAKQHK